MGAVYGALGSYLVGFLLLAVTAASTALSTATTLRRRRARRARLEYAGVGNLWSSDDCRWRWR